MNEFIFWFKMGFEHIADWDALDHLLFLTALCGIYSIKTDVKTIFILVTAFTIGHSSTLALCTLDFIKPNSLWVEFLIPLSIVITALFNLITIKQKNKSSIIIKYAAALFFGLIHGMGFSSVLKSLLGNDENLVFTLFSFNIGVEAGQILVVFILLIFSLFLNVIFKLKAVYYTFGVSIVVLIPAIIITINRFLELLNS